MEFLNEQLKNENYILPLVAMYSFVNADYDGQEPIKISTATNYLMQGKLSLSETQKIIDLLEALNYIELDEKIGWIKLKNQGFDFFEATKYIFFEEEDFDIKLVDLVMEYFYANRIALQNRPPTIRAEPSSICTVAGTWYTIHDRMREINMKVGDKFPPQTMGVTGDIIWYWKHA